MKKIKGDIEADQGNEKGRDYGGKNAEKENKRAKYKDEVKIDQENVRDKNAVL